MSEFRRRLMMIGSGGFDGHQIAQVIMPVGSYLDTEYYPNNRTRVELGIIPLSKYRWGLICMGKESPNTKQFAIYYRNEVDRLLIYCGTSVSSDKSNKNIDLRPLTHYDIVFSDTALVVNGTSYPYDAGQTFTCPNQLCINGGTAEAISESIFDYFKIYDNDVLVRNYIPWKRGNGTVGMLDTVNNVFYQSATSVSFTDGTIVLPNGYTRLNYITFTGAQRFQTDFTPNQATNYIIKCEFKGTSAWKNIISSKISSSSRAFELANGTNISANSKLYFRYNNGTSGINVNHNNKVLTFCKSENYLYIYVDGIYYNKIDRTYGSFTAPTTLTIGSENANGAYASYFSGDVYDIDFFGLAHYIPCIAPDNVVGMYDVINNVFKASETETPLVAGTVYGQ